jgi:hypothetical protein
VPGFKELMRAQLVADTAVSAIIGEKLWALKAKKGTSPPYATFTVAAYTREGHLRGTTKLENARIRFDLYGGNYPELDDLADAIAASLNNTSGFTAQLVFGFEMYEDDTQLYHLVRDFSVWHTLN